jgi:hypothetical protein
MIDTIPLNIFAYILFSSFNKEEIKYAKEKHPIYNLLLYIYGVFGYWNGRDVLVYSAKLY